MTPVLLSVTYRLRVPAQEFRIHAETAAASIAKAPGLVWKIWGLDPETGLGTSFYLFGDAATAEAFATGPAIKELRNGPGEDMSVRLAPVDRKLSTITHATEALAPAETAGRP